MFQLFPFDVPAFPFDVPGFGTIDFSRRFGKAICILLVVPHYGERWCSGGFGALEPEVAGSNPPQASALGP